MKLGRTLILIVTLSVSMGLGVSSLADDANPDESFGLSKAKPIEVCKPDGQRAYLGRLVCPSGATPEFVRIGGFGPRTSVPDSAPKDQQMAALKKAFQFTTPAPGEMDYHNVDGFDLACGSNHTTVYVDMYHCDRPPTAVAPRGFTLRPNK
jgi:hypothetical protein